ncbi:Hypp2341 [Branchiostoma lanceolatum]|uniref:Hypp2341 protein n=1 Tax=Branchiostoma lanceolatum TaxID=7740 RepID=A0A8J9ZQ02_BRALA|nr:Hypp2341 [Branchiostoma lanceolatum]
MQAEKPRTLQMASTERELETYRLNQKETRRLQEVTSQLERSEKIQVRSLSQESDVVYQDLERLHARELTPSLSEWLQGRVSTKKSAQRKFLARKIDSPKARARRKAAGDAEKRLGELAYTNRMFRASVEQMMGDPAVVDDTSAVETVARHNTSPLETVSRHNTSAGETVSRHNTSPLETVSRHSTSAVETVAGHSTSPVETVARHSTSPMGTVARQNTSPVESVARHVTFLQDSLSEGDTDVDSRQDGAESREQELDAEAAE